MASIGTIDSPVLTKSSSERCRGPACREPSTQALTFMTTSCPGRRLPDIGCTSNHAGVGDPPGMGETRSNRASASPTFVMLKLADASSAYRMTPNSTFGLNIEHLGCEDIST